VVRLDQPDVIAAQTNQRGVLPPLMVDEIGLRPGDSTVSAERLRTERPNQGCALDFQHDQTAVLCSGCRMWWTRSSARCSRC
jgi:hypothetical protein